MKHLQRRHSLALAGLALLFLGTSALDAQVAEPAPCQPVPTEQQIRWQEMEMYAFLHFSLNTYTDQEWGLGNESPQLFNPTALDARQWARVCRQSGMRGIILTAKHHSGFCLWPSAYTDYSVKSSPWKQGQGDVVRELAEACRAEGLRFAVYLSPWDRHHPDYGRPAYVTYFQNQLRELLTQYGPMFEVWFDGANGGDGYYGGVNERREIDRRTYYRWPETYKMIRQWQPDCVIWGDTWNRADLRWIGNEAGHAGPTCWSTLPKEGKPDRRALNRGVEGGDVWCPGEADTSIRPGWFYHEREDTLVKSLATLMDIYYKSVGRNVTLLLNFPIMPNGRIHPTDSIRGLQFAREIRRTFRHDLARKAKATATNVRGASRRYAPARAVDGKPATYWATDDTVRHASLTLSWRRPTAVNRILLGEPIALGQRIRAFRLEALVDGQWQPIRDSLADEDFSTIGYRRIVCFPTVAATQLRLTVTDARACPLLSRFSAYLATEE